MKERKIEPIVLLLCGLVIFYSLCLIVVAKIMSSDGQTFQIIAGLVTGFSGALLMRVKPRGPATEDPDIPMPLSPSKVTVNKTEQTETKVETKDGHEP